MTGPELNVPAMFRKNDLRQNEELDRAGRHLVGASVLSDEDASAAASSPFLFSRVCARIALEREQREAGGLWSSFWLVSQKAIPAMGLVAAVSFGLFLYTKGNKSTNPAFSVDAYLGTNDSGIDSIVFAERRPLTTEEVLATIVSKDEREAAR